MSRILLLLDHQSNRRLLAEWLTTHYQVVLPESDEALQEPFDLCMLDGPALKRLWEQVQARKRAEEPIFVPVLLLTTHQGMARAMRHLWRAIDEVLRRPIEQVELQARVESLLRARRLSLAVNGLNEDLRAFIDAMAHELRAPLRAIAGFAQELGADEGSALSGQGTHYLGCIQASAAQMGDLIASLLEFGRLGRGEVRLRSVSLQSVVESCLRTLEADIRACNARVTVSGGLTSIRADASLLKIALTNLLSNALTFVRPGERPRVTISASVARDGCRVEVEDHGIGIAPEHGEQIFTPFVRLHSVEEYPGIGLGLATAAKAVEMMGGRIGVISEMGTGSRFWIELSSAEVGDEIFDRR